MKKQSNNKLIVYRTSSDYYQTQFISFFDRMINFESWPISKNKRIRFGSKWANILLDKLEYLQEEKESFDFYQNVITDEGSKYANSIRIDKIVGVTLSSHLLAEEIRDIYAERLGLNKEDEPQLIKLTNYYEFYNEIPFEQIGEGDNVLIVNDVISTGKLNSELYKSLTDIGKKANVVAVFSLVDTRIPQEEYLLINDNELRVTHYYSEAIERKLVSVVRYPIAKYKSIDQIPDEIRKGRKVDEIRINSVLNAPSPVVKRSEQITRKLLYNDNNEEKTGYQFLKNIYEFEDSRKSLCIGHIESFGFHHPYYIDTNILFQSDSGKKLIEGLILDVKDLENDIIKKRNKNHISKISDRFTKLKKENPSLTYTTRKRIDYLLQKTKLIKQAVSSAENQNKFKVDFVIHASDSGFDNVKRNEFESIFRKTGSNDDFQVIRMPRIMMNQRWGIPNIPNSYKHIFEGKRILILDSASCTGETLLNLIDSMCYLDVSKITVLSVITRMKEIQGEFLTRIYKINNNKGDYPNSSIPIDIYFGVHLNLPFYLGNSNQCPHCREIHDYKEILYKTNPPKSVEDSINYSRSFLKTYKITDTKFSESKGHYADYIPKGIDVCKMFQIRDELGKKELQKAHNKYFKNDIIRDDFFESVDINIFDEVIGVILHEPHLIDIIRKEQANVYYALKIIIDYNTVRFIPQKPGNKKFRIKLKMRWDRPSLLFVYSFFFEDEFFVDGQRNESSDILLDQKFLTRLLLYAEESLSEIKQTDSAVINLDEECLNHVAYLVWIRQVHPKIDQKNMNDLEAKSKGLFIIINELRKNSKKYFKLQTRRLLNKLVFHLSLNRAINRNTSLGEASFYLYKIFTNIETEGTNHGNLFTKVSDLGRALENLNYRSIISLWNDDVRIKFQEILDVCEVLRPAFEAYKQVSHYKKLFDQKSSLTSFFLEMDDLVEQIGVGQYKNDLFITSNIAKLSSEVDILLNYFFEHKAQFYLFASTYHVDIIKMWRHRCNLLNNLGFTVINIGEEQDPVELIINMPEMLANYIIFNQLEVNLNSYAIERSEINFFWTKGQDYVELTIRNRKKSPDSISDAAVKSTFNGLENWKRLLPMYGIETAHTGLLSEERTFETRFRFNKKFINYGN